MSYMMLELETEDVRHGEDEDAELKYQELLIEKGLVESEEDLAARLKKTALVPIVCSCGSVRCWAIKQFGLPRPLFAEHIEPLQPQGTRDRKAEVMVKETAA